MGANCVRSIICRQVVLDLAEEVGLKISLILPGRRTHVRGIRKLPRRRIRRCGRRQGMREPPGGICAERGERDSADIVRFVGKERVEAFVDDWWRSPRRKRRAAW